MEEAICHYANAGVRNINTIYLDYKDQQQEQITESSNLFFKMKCKLHLLDKNYINNDFFNYVVHFYYPNNDQPINGMRPLDRSLFYKL